MAWQHRGGKELMARMVRREQIERFRQVYVAERGHDAFMRNDLEGATVHTARDCKGISVADRKSLRRSDRPGAYVGHYWCKWCYEHDDRLGYIPR